MASAIGQSLASIAGKSGDGQGFGVWTFGVLASFRVHSASPVSPSLKLASLMSAWWLTPVITTGGELAAGGLSFPEATGPRPPHSPCSWRWVCRVCLPPSKVLGKQKWPKPTKTLALMVPALQVEEKDIKKEEREDIVCVSMRVTAKRDERCRCAVGWGGRRQGNSQVGTALHTHGFPAVALKYIMSFHCFCFTSLDIWDGSFMPLSLVTLNFMTSCPGLPPNRVPLPLGSYICVCHLPFGHAAEHGDKSLTQSLAMPPLSSTDSTRGPLSFPLWLLVFERTVLNIYVSFHLEYA